MHFTRFLHDLKNRAGNEEVIKNQLKKYKSVFKDTWTTLSKNEKICLTLGKNVKFCAVGFMHKRGQG